MEKIHSVSNLQEAIRELEYQQAVEAKLLREQFNLAYESIQPINIIKKTFREVSASHELKSDILNTSVGLIVGFLSKKLFENVSDSPMKKLFGTAILFGITNLVAQNPETVKAIGTRFLNLIMRKSNERIHGISN